MCLSIMSFLGFGRKSQSKKEMINRLKAEKEILESSEEASKKKILNLDDETKDLRRSVQQLEFEKKELEQKLDKEEPYEKIYNERRELMQHAGVKDSKIYELEGKRKELCETVENLKSELKLVQDKNVKLNSEVDSLRTQVEDTSKGKEELELQMKEVEKDKEEYESEITQLKEEFDKIRMEKEAWDHNNQTKEEKLVADKAVSTDAIGYIEETRLEVLEHKRKADDLQLASEALKAENESLFRANESKAKEVNEIKKELTEIKQELTREQLNYSKLQQEWEEDRRGTEFVLVSKSAKSRQNRSRAGTLETTREENDSEDEHILSLVESAKAESEALREKERAYRKRISELQTDKADLFRSGSNIFMENKSLKARYDGLLGERDKLLKSEDALRRKTREQAKEIADLKKTVDDMHYQNIAIKANDDNEHKRNAYVVVMGNEMIKTLEREKSALYRRVKYLEKENDEIESRVNELQKQSDTLLKYTQTGDRRPSVSNRNRDRQTDADIILDQYRNNFDYGQNPSKKESDVYPNPRSPSHRLYSQDQDRKPPSGNKDRRYKDPYDDTKPTQYRNYSRMRDQTFSHMSRRTDVNSEERHPLPLRTGSRDPYSDDQQPTPSRDTSRNPFTQAFDPFRPRQSRHAPTIETLASDTGKSHGSQISLPRINGRLSPRPVSQSSKGPHSRRVTPNLGRQ